MQSLIFFGNLLVVSFLFFFIFFIPGNGILLLKKENLKDEEKVFLSISLGIVLFTVFAVIFGLLKLRLLVLPLFVLMDIYLIKKASIKKYLSSFKFLIEKKSLLLLVFLAILLMGFINFPSGWKFKEGIYFWSSQGHDGLWHVALMEEIKNHFPPNNPLYAGRPLVNYHFSVDILMGEFYRIFPFFNSLDLYFRFFPVLFSFLISLGAYCFAQRRWGENAGLWAIFFTCFCGSFGYIVSIERGGFLFSGETTFWASQGNTILGNPPHAMGIILLTAVLVVLQLWQKNKDTFWLYLLLFLGFGLSTVKVSSGLVVVVAVGIAGLYFFITQKKPVLLIFSAILGFSNLVLLKIISPSAESFLSFMPLWFPRTMMVAKLDNVDWELRRQHYIWKNTPGSFLHLVWLEFWAAILFVVGNSGTRILGIVEEIKKFRKKIDVVDVFTTVGLVVPIIIVLLFIQKGIVFNLIQFMQIYLHIFGILAAGSIVFILKKLKKPLICRIISILIIFVSIPTALGNLFDFYGKGKNPLAKVSNSEIEALSWIKNNSRESDIILTVPFKGGGEYRYKNQPWPISAWYSTSYVFVFSGRYAYLSGEEQLMITGYNTKIDLEKINNFFSQTDLNESEKFIKDNNLKFIYLRKDEIKKPIAKEVGDLKINEVFENEEVLVYQII